MEPASAARVGVALASAALLAWRGLRKGSLSVGGAWAAAGVGFASLAALPRSGVAMLVFYWSGSRLTRVGAARKGELEQGFAAGVARGPGQVLACSAIATGLTLAHLALVGAQDRLLFKHSAAREGGQEHAALVLGIAAHYAACAADTWSSELGVLSSSWPRLITSGRPVPPGTNGGVSVVGLLAAVGGGAAIGLAMFLSGLVLNDNQKCPVDDISLVPLCAAFGLAGSLLDSLLGAVAQETLYDDDLKQVVKQRGPGVKVVCGRPLLSNEGVNLVSVAVVTAAGCAYGWVASSPVAAS
jgi:uncharacterized protein (TIGR00297 family)